MVALASTACEKYQEITWLYCSRGIQRRANSPVLPTSSTPTVALYCWRTIYQVMEVCSPAP